MRLTRLDEGIFLLYMLVVLGVGFIATRRGKQTKRDYFLAGDKLPWWMIGASVVASNISSHHLVGVMGTAYNRGFVAMVIEWGAILIGFNALLWIFLPFYLRNGFYTVPEFLNRRYGTGARTVYGVLVLLTYLFVEISAVLYMGGLALYALVGIPVSYSVIVLAIATGIYTIGGGLRAVVWTEMLQLGVLLMGGLALSLATIHAAGGISSPWTMYIGGSLCISVFYCATNQFIVQRALAAKDEWHARMGIVFTDYLKFLLPLIIIVPGLLAPKLLPDLAKADLVFPTLVKTLLPAGLVGLVMAGLIAAVMGHTSGAINSCTTIATIDFYLPWMRRRQRETNDQSAVRFGRLCGVLVVIIGIAWAQVLNGRSQKPIFLYLLNAYGYFTPGIATMFLLGILWKRTTHAGAMTAGLLTIPLSLAMQFMFPRLPFQNRTGIVFWTCIVACAVVSLVTVAKTDEELKGLIWTKDALRLPPEQRDRMRGIRNPTLWWAIVTAAVVFFYVRFA